MPYNTKNPLKTSMYLLDSITKSFHYEKDLILSLKYELERHIYYYGNHFRHPFENNINDNSIDNLFNNILYKIRNINYTLDKIKNWPQKAHFRDDKRNIAVCNAYFKWEKYLTTKRIAIHPPLWAPRKDANPIEGLLREQCQLVQHVFRLGFHVILHPEFIKTLQKVTENIKEYYSHSSVKAFIFPYTNPYFEYITIKIFNELKKKTFLVDHGHSTIKLCPRYCKFDYYVVWGGSEYFDLTNNWIKKEQILTSGSPIYQTLPAQPIKKVSLDDTLVLTYPIAGAPSSEVPIYPNRAIPLDYVYNIQYCLEKCGVKNAMLRPHPSESIQWFRKFTNSNFYTLTDEGLESALSKAGLVIGERTTVLFDALYHRVNYLCYMPKNYNEALPNKQDPPFDGKNKKVPVAETEDDLIYFLKNKITVDPSILEDYIHFPFNPRAITDILDEL